MSWPHHHVATHPALVALALALASTLALVRHRDAAAREHDLASARLQRGAASPTRMQAGPLKTDMLIFPAVIARPDRAGHSEVTFPATTLGPTLAGWVALDDDDAKLRRRGGHRILISAAPPGDTSWTTLLDLLLPHRPDRHHLDSVPVPPHLQGLPVDLRVTVTTTGEQPPRLGFDLHLP